jgi:hypothetical protein
VTREQKSKINDKLNSHSTKYFGCNVFFELIKSLKTKKKIFHSSDGSLHLEEERVHTGFLLGPKIWWLADWRT